MHTLGLGDGADVVLDGRRDVHHVGGFGAGDELLHVEGRARVVHGPAFGHRHHGDRVVHALGGERGAVHRVDGDVALGTFARADLLAVEEHGGLVLLALADDDDATHRHRADQSSHGVDGGLVGAVLVAAPDPPGGCERGRLGHSDEFEGEVAVRCLPLDGERTRKVHAFGCHGTETSCTWVNPPTDDVGCRWLAGRGGIRCEPRARKEHDRSAFGPLVSGA